ncbi:MAG: hydroxyacylglutathione hydrolase, partial [Gammaproteobacteria bacterium]
FSDNYIWLIQYESSERRVAVVDPGDSGPVIDYLDAGNLELAAILITHHHGDHVGGVRELVARFDVPVYGPAGENIPCRTTALSGGDEISIDGPDLRFEVLDVPGHTAGHIAFYGHGALFCGDTLFSAGCGRLFEGTPRQMSHSLDALAALPPATRVYCTHEYTLANLRFATQVEPDNAALTAYAMKARTQRADDEPTLPSTLALETQVNPFLRCDQETVRSAAEDYCGRRLDDRVDVFAAIRAWKDEF